MHFRLKLDAEVLLLIQSLHIQLNLPCYKQKNKNIRKSSKIKKKLEIHFEIIVESWILNSSELEAESQSCASLLEQRNS